MDNKLKQSLDIRAIMNILLVVGVGLAVVTLVLSFTAKAVVDATADFTGNSSEYNITQNGKEGMADLSAQFDTIGLIGAVLVVILLVLVIARSAGV